MFFQFSTEQKMMQKMAREFAEKEIAPLDAAMDKSGEFPLALFDKMKAQGLLGVVFPEEYSGGGCDNVTSALVIYEIAKASASVALTLDAHWLAADTILYHGSAEQKKKYLPQAATNTIFAFSLTEPSAGSDAAGILTTAVAEGDGAAALDHLHAAMEGVTLSSADAALHLLRAQALWQQGRQDEARTAMDTYRHMAGVQA